MKRYRHVGLRKPPHYFPCDPAYYLDGFPGQALMTSGFAWRCPACRDTPADSALCQVCNRTGQVALDDKRVHRAQVSG